MLRGLLALAGVLIASVSFGQEADKQRKADLTVFQDFLKDKYKGKKWKTGPTPIETPELKQAFPNLRFYYVYSALPGEMKDLIAELKRLRKLELEGKGQENPWLSLTVAIDNQGKLQALAGPADYRKLLPRVNSHEEAKATAALILSLHPSGHKPSRVTADDVEVLRDRDGWSCSVSNREEGFSGSVHFNPEGEFVSVSSWRAKK